MIEVAPILSLEEYVKMKEGKDPTFMMDVCISGGFDPIHPGHISYITEASRLGSTLVVIVNGDSFLTTKKGKPFQDLETRCQIVAGIKNVEWVIPFEVENDQSICEALKVIKPFVFANGGDRGAENIPEYDICQELGIKMRFGVGKEKQWSSSNMLKNWTV